MSGPCFIFYMGHCGFGQLKIKSVLQTYIQLPRCSRKSKYPPSPKLKTEYNKNFKRGNRF
jgi:hypothetical protein